MIAPAPFASQNSLQAEDALAGPRPLGDLLPAVLARYGISATDPDCELSARQESTGHWPGIKIDNPAATDGLVAVC